MVALHSQVVLEQFHFCCSRRRPTMDYVLAYAAAFANLRHYLKCSRPRRHLEVTRLSEKLARRESRFKPAEPAGRHRLDVVRGGRSFGE